MNQTKVFSRVFACSPVKKNIIIAAEILAKAIEMIVSTSRLLFMKRFNEEKILFGVFGTEIDATYKNAAQIKEMVYIVANSSIFGMLSEIPNIMQKIEK